jgi:ABC-2 type transport system permease protein
MIAEQLAFKIGNFVITPYISMAIVLIFGIIFLLLSTSVFSKVDFSTINRSKTKEGDIWS